MLLLHWCCWCTIAAAYWCCCCIDADSMVHWCIGVDAPLLIFQINRADCFPFRYFFTQLIFFIFLLLTQTCNILPFHTSWLFAVCICINFHMILKFTINHPTQSHFEKIALLFYFHFFHSFIPPYPTQSNFWNSFAFLNNFTLFNLSSHPNPTHKHKI